MGSMASQAYVGKHAAQKHSTWGEGDTPPTPTPRGGYRNTPNDLGIAYILLLLGGLLGVHRFYLGRNGSAITMAIMSILIVGLPITAIWWLADLFLLPGIFHEETNG
jgi:hypothetical protein